MNDQPKSQDNSKAVPETSYEQLRSRFNEIPADIESSEKMRLRLTTAQECHRDLDNLRFVDFIDNITKWVNGWSDCGAKTVLLSNPYLQFVIPLLPSILKNDVVGLDLCGNRLTSLPSNISELTNLRWLWLAGNKLKTLPESLDKLTNLQVLWIDDAVEIPNSLATKKTLCIKRGFTED